MSICCCGNKLSFNYPSNIQFECDGCALCCGNTEHKKRHILLLESEAKVISKHTNLQLEKFIKKNSNTQPYKYEMKKSNLGKCFFLKNNQCSIYEYRPLICRFYPFELRFDEDKGMYIFNFTFECPRINQGPLLSKQYFEELFNIANQRLP